MTGDKRSMECLAWAMGKDVPDMVVAVAGTQVLRWRRRRGWTVTKHDSPDETDRVARTITDAAERFGMRLLSVPVVLAVRSGEDHGDLMHGLLRYFRVSETDGPIKVPVMADWPYDEEREAIPGLGLQWEEHVVSLDGAVRSPFPPPLTWVPTEKA